MSEVNKRHSKGVVLASKGQSRTKSSKREMSFLRRLDDAKTEAQSEQKDITPTKKQHKGQPTRMESDAPRLDGAQSEQKEITPIKKLHMGAESEAVLNERLDAELAEYRAEETLVTLCAEYIFDLFDANMLEDYKTMEAFETMAIDAFPDYKSTEITFEQERLHREFMDLFESLIDKFLREKGATHEQFYIMLHDYLSGKKSAAASKESAVEVVDCIFAYTDLTVWCAAMRERSEMRAKWVKRQGKEDSRKKKMQLPRTELQEAFDRTLHRSPSTSHRFDLK